MARLRLEEARQAICWPEPASLACDQLIASLSAHGVKHYISTGPVALGAGLRLLGRGWASNVFLAETVEGLAAVKVLRPGSRRATLLHEAAMQMRASDARAAPRVLIYTKYFIASQPLLGGTLEDSKPGWPVLRLAIVKAYLLDLLHISHNELARPHRQILLGDEDEPYIIDYESATITDSASNVTQLVGGLVRMKLLPPPRDRLRALLREYRSHPPHRRTDKLNAILEELERTLKDADNEE